MVELVKETKTDLTHLDQAVAELKENSDNWAKISNARKIKLLDEMREGFHSVAKMWVDTAARKKQIPPGAQVAGEEWSAGPYAVISACNALMETISGMDGKKFLKKIPVRELPNGQIAAKLIPGSLWDQLLLTGFTAEAWMQKDVTKANLAEHTASAYDIPISERKGKVALVLGAGNIAAIAPLDCFQKLFTEHQVVILKMNPVNDYLTEFLQIAMKPLIDIGALRIVKGGTDVGEYLCNHPDIEEIHITGAGASHDAIVWGVGEEGRQNKANGTPRNTRRITSELGAVCPTIVVPGPWNDGDIKYHAEHIASQKLHNSGFNCVACQMLILPEKWDKTDKLLSEIETVMKNADARQPYYPGARDRVEDFSKHGSNVLKFERPGTDACIISSHLPGDDSWLEHNEVFAPAMSTFRLDDTDEESYLREAIRYSNENLHGTLGANIIIHPATIKKIGKKKFEEIITDLHYGCIAINTWTGVGFLLVHTPWGAFPGHTPDDVQSGIGFVHNTYMFDKPERTVVKAPFRVFPRPPWFITNKNQYRIGEALTKFQHNPGWLRLFSIFNAALKG